MKRRHRPNILPTDEAAGTVATLPRDQAPQLNLTTELRPRLGEVLLDQNLLSPEALSSALDLQQASGRRLGAILVESGLVDPNVLNEALAHHFGVETIDLRRVKPTDEALDLVTETPAREHRVMPIKISDGVLEIALADPGDPAARAYLASLPVASIHVYMAPLVDVTMAQNTYYRIITADDAAVQQFWADSAPVVESLSERDADAPVIHLVNRLVAQALRDRASDLHIEPTDGRVRVRFRVDGALHEALSLPLSTGLELVSRLKVMAEMDIVERRRPQDGQFQTVVDGMSVDVRVATASTIWGETAVLRILDKSRSMKQLGELGMPQASYDRYMNILHKPYGMILCSGPTGSGKTTTLYASLAQISRAEINIMTIEDPVEYVFPSINQMQILPQAGITFVTGLKSILRQDPDVILVGEIRDEETARIATQSALTGHVVMSSIHATDSCSAMFRLTDMGIESFLVGSALVGIVGQRLVRRICPSCTEGYVPPRTELDWYERLGGDVAGTEFLRGAGCAFCAGSGFRERVGVYEVLEVNDEIAHMVVSGATPQAVREVARKSGMQTMGEEGMLLVGQGVTTIAEVIRNVHVH
jgi:type IV pilus assembly protein PilB